VEEFQDFVDDKIAEVREEYNRARELILKSRKLVKPFVLKVLEILDFIKMKMLSFFLRMVPKSGSNYHGGLLRLQKPLTKLSDFK
jgi:hypothetical protein